MMENKVWALPAGETRACVNCGEHSAHLSFEDESFAYGIGENQVCLKARVPVWTCADCGEQFTDGDAESIRHAEVCRHLGRLAPADVRAVRERYGLSQQEWAAQTGLGVASVKRWETGSLIQNDATDRYLRLLGSADVFARVSRMGRSASRENKVRFQTELPEAAYICAPAFMLRKAHG